MATYKTLEFDKAGTHFYETGVKKCVLYPYVGIGNTYTDSYGNETVEATKDYPFGVAWNGISSISESPSGAEASPIYADDIKYLNLYSKEEFGATVEAYTYPDEWAECDGSAEPIPGVKFGQQSRKSFGLSYVTTEGDDADGEYYKIHLIYGCKASPSERQYSTINDSPEAITFSWTIDTIATSAGDGYEATSCVTVDSRKFQGDEGKAKLKKLEDALYGVTTAEDSEGSAPYLPTPAEVVDLLSDVEL